MRYAVAHGQRSGRGRAGLLARKALHRLRDAGHEVTLIEESSIEATRTACRALIDDGVDVLAVAGGDGMVSMAIDVCVGSRTAVAILPAGTGNDSARSLGIPLRPEAAVQTLMDGRRRRVDTIHVPELGRYLLGSLTAALDARINHRATTFPRILGAANYTLATLVEVARLPWTQPLHYRLEIDGVIEEVDTLVVTVANLSHFGGGLPIVPQADHSDGQLALVLVRPLSPTSALGLVHQLRQARHSEHPAVQIRPVERVRIWGPSDVLPHGDGEALSPLPLTAQVAPANLEVIVPALT